MSSVTREFGSTSSCRAASSELKWDLDELILRIPPRVQFSYQTVRYPLDMRISTAYYSNRSVQKSPSQGLALLKW